jgi:hypothetical protein
MTTTQQPNRPTPAARFFYSIWTAIGLIVLTLIVLGVVVFVAGLLYRPSKPKVAAPAPLLTVKTDDHDFSFMKLPLLADYPKENLNIEALTTMQIRAKQQKRIDWVRSKAGKTLQNERARFYDAKIADSYIDGTSQSVVDLTFFLEPSGVLVTAIFPNQPQYVDYWSKVKKDTLFGLSGTVKQFNFHDQLGMYNSNNQDMKPETMTVRADAMFHESLQIYRPKLVVIEEHTQ